MTGLRFQEAMVNPCLGCTRSPCCTWLFLHSFRISKLMELDYARYLLNFDRILLGLNTDWEWRVYYHHPCRHLDRETALCRVHDGPDQPSTCRSYNPYDCDYRRIFAPPDDSNPAFLRVDRGRLEALAGAMLFADDRALIGIPEWSAMRAAMPALQIPEWGDDPPADPLFDAWRARAIGQAAPGSGAKLTADDLRDPCGACAAPCCTTLSFPYNTPHSLASLEHLRYSLGYPGVEVGVSPEGWVVSVRARCRHLEGSRCGVYGQPERPLLCRYYDETHCAYKARYGAPVPRAFVRFRLEEFPAVRALFRFDVDGRVTQRPEPDAIRAAIEALWRSQAAEASPGGSEAQPQNAR